MVVVHVSTAVGTSVWWWYMYQQLSGGPCGGGTCRYQQLSGGPCGGGTCINSCREVRVVVVHVGINSCWENTLRDSDWRQLVRLLKSVFPSSQLILSSIVPPAFHHPLGKTIPVSNTALAAVCSSERVVLVYHTEIFTTNTGAPRKELYSNPLHVGRKGIIMLAQNIGVHMKGHSIKLRPAVLNNNSQRVSGHTSPTTHGT